MDNSIAIGHVIRILDNYTVIVDAGASLLKIGDSIQIYQLGEPILDLDGNELSKYIFIKDILNVIDVQDQYSICKKEKTVPRKNPSSFVLSPLLLGEYPQEQEKLKVNESDIEPLGFIDSYIKIGDLIKLAWHFILAMVRWSSTEMVVVEMTSENPSYRCSEGGIFSIYGRYYIW